MLCWIFQKVRTETYDEMKSILGRLDSSVVPVVTGFVGKCSDYFSYQNNSKTCIETYKYNIIYTI